MRPEKELAFEAQTSEVVPTTYDLTAKPDAYTAASYSGGSAFTDITSTGGAPIFQGRNKAMLVSYNSVPTEMVQAGGVEYTVSLNFQIVNLFLTNSDVSTFCNNHFSGTFTEDVKYEPVYEILVDTKVIGLYLLISDCKTHATNKDLKLGFKIDSAGGFTGSFHTFTLSSRVVITRHRGDVHRARGLPTAQISNFRYDNSVDLSQNVSRKSDLLVK